MVARNYSNIAVNTSLGTGIGAVDTSLTVASATGWPAAPFLLIVEPDTAKEEIILVGAKVGAVFSSLTRGFGGTSGVAHNAGSVVKHVVVAEDHSLVWSHLHTGGAGDSTSQIAHTSLTGILADQHHLQDHASRHASGGADQLSHDVLAGVSADDHHTQNHQTRHIPGGADPLATAIAGVSSPGDTAAEGTATSFSRSDHRHGREALITPSRVRAKRVTTGFSIPTAVLTAIQWNAEDFDTDGFHDNVTNPSRFTVPSGKAGLYLISGLLRFPGGSLGGAIRMIAIAKNGAFGASDEEALIQLSPESTSIVSHSMQISILLDLIVGDYVECIGYQDTGSTQDVTGTIKGRALFEMVRLGA